jgi:hydroxyacylglutathione hydrolase
VPSTIAEERATNPFLRSDAPAVRAAAEAQQPGAGAAAVSTFAAIRAWKNRF